MKNLVIAELKTLRSLLLLIGIAALMLSPLYSVTASDISNAHYYGNISATNNSSSAASGVAAVFTTNTTAMIANGFLNSSANDCAMQDSTGADIAFMPGYSTNPWVFYAGDFTSYQVKTSVLYTTNVSGGNIEYFPGNAGMSVSDNSNMEWGNSGNLTIAGRFDPTSTGNIYSKPGALSLGGDGAGNIAGAIYGASGALFPSIASSTTSTGTGATSLTVNLAPGFVTDDLSIVVVSTYKNAAGGDAAITPATGWTQLFETGYTNTNYWTHGAWYKVLDGTESTTQSWSSNASVSYSSVALRIDKNNYAGVPVAGTTAAGASVNPDPPSLTSGYGNVDTLWLAVCEDSTYSSNPAPTSYTNVSYNGSSNYYTYVAYRNRTIATENPSTFGIANGTWEANTIAIEGASVVRVLGVSAAVPTFNLSLSGGTFSLQVDSNTPSTVSYAGNVTNNANPITFCTNGIMPYVSSIKTYAGGVLSGSWAWQFGSTFTDLSGYGNTATPTFRTNSSDSDVTASLDSLYPVTEAKAAAATVVGNAPWNTAPEKPSGLTIVTGAIHNPLYPFLHSLFSGNSSVEILFWYVLSFFIIWGGGLLAIRYGKSIFVKTIVMGALMLGGALSNVYGIWMMITWGCAAFGIIIMSRHYGFG
jgi:hypothetical protein